MKRLCLIAVGVFLLFAGNAEAALCGKEAHEKYLYPIVRVTIDGAGGSGTIIFSKESGGKYSNYVLTNHHVIDGAIRIEDRWDSTLGKNIKEEKRSVVYVEIFKYKNLGTPVGTMKVEADIALYNVAADLALLKLRLTEKVEYTALLPAKDKANDHHLFDETVAVGCSLGFPPIATVGILNRKNMQIDSLPYHMSTSQIIYGNSGGAMFLANGTFIGIPSRGMVVGWGTPVTHMGLFIPVDRIYQWFSQENYDFLFDPLKTEEKCLKEREERIKKQKEK